MKTSQALSGFLLAAGMGNAAQAVNLESGVVFGGPGQTHVACLLVNSGNAPVTLLTRQLVGQFSGVLKPTYDDCGKTLEPNRICSFQVPTATNESASCKVVIRQDTKDVRGTMMSLGDPVDAPLSQSDLR
ncbi:MAG: hypothetical protein U1E83_05685 [Methylotetracoccus sp.]